MTRNKILLHTGNLLYFDSAKDVFSKSTPGWVKHNIEHDPQFYAVKEKIRQGVTVKAICWNKSAEHGRNGVIHCLASPDVASVERLNKLASCLQTMFSNDQPKLATILEPGNALNAAHLTIGHAKGKNIRSLTTEFSDFALPNETFSLCIDSDTPLRVTEGGYLVLQLQQTDLLMGMHRGFVAYHQEKLKRKGWALTRFHQVQDDEDYEGFVAHVSIGKFDLSTLSDLEAQDFIARKNAHLKDHAGSIHYDNLNPLSFLPAEVRTSDWVQTSSCQFKFYESNHGSEWACPILPDMPKYDKSPNNRSNRVLACKRLQRQPIHVSSDRSFLGRASLFRESGRAKTVVLKKNSLWAKTLLSLLKLRSAIDFSQAITPDDPRFMHLNKYAPEKDMTILRLDLGENGYSGIEKLLAVSDQLDKLGFGRKHVYINDSTCEIHFVDDEASKVLEAIQQDHRLQTSQPTCACPYP